MQPTQIEAEGSAFQAAAAYTPRRRTAALIAVALAFVMDLVDTTIVNVALPSIDNDLGAGPAALEWIVAGYAIAFSVLLIVGGRLGDSQGYKRMFLLGIVLFTAASLCCGAATSMHMLDIGRLLQGASAALMVPQVMALVQVMYPPEQRHKVYATFGFLGGFSAALGPIIGGLLIEANWFDLGWRLAFLINLPIGLISVVAGALMLPAGRSVHPVRVDWGGTLLTIAVALAILLPLIEGPSLHWPWWSVAALLAAAPLAWLTARYLVWRDRKHDDALVRPALLRQRRVALGLLCCLCINPIIPGYLLVMTLVLQGGYGLSASQMAYACAPIALGAMLGISLLGPRLHKRLGVRAVIPGVLAQMIGLCVLGWTVNQAALPQWALIVGQLCMGLGLGLSGPPLSNVTLQDVPLRDAGVASGLLTAVQQMAGALGVALGGLLYFHGGGNAGVQFLHTLPLFLGLLGCGLLVLKRID
ncbi:MFS transporter [Duganella sp. FT80W]|uniref:MFS transporter n=1 Tax=Duganella guangzhouensis TaxID=2666084 RepID=A0A6I2KXU6_9BURK|nr:MFS transporter [Duganella guangzhouensis]MRW89817.1 MFS transporter [Duganella guangzhouensis]